MRDIIEEQNKKIIQLQNTGAWMKINLWFKRKFKKNV
jgi:hypothetical protein